MRTRKQAATVAELIGGAQLAGNPRKDATAPPSRYVDVGADFEAHRLAVESVSVLFELYDGTAASYATTSSPGEKLPTGWPLTAAKFEVEWPAEEDRRATVRSHFGARRDASRVRFTTGTMRVEDDRRTITVPVIGSLRSKENTRRVQRHLAAGRAQIVNMTVSQQWGRLFVSVNYALRTPHTARVVTAATVRAGMDLGVRTLATVATIDTATGEQTIIEYPNPAPLRATLTARRRAGRQLSRRIPGSRGHQAAKAKLTRLDRRCVHLRQEAAHQLTTELAGSYGHLVIEDLDVAAMKRSMGRRAFRRAVSDAGIGAVKPQLAYKTARCDTVLTVADRWFPSSQIHHGCIHPNDTPCRLVGKGRIDKSSCAH